MSEARSIMMVDSDKEILVQYEQYFTSRGYTFFPINDPKQLVHQLKEKKPSIMLIEIDLKNYRGDNIIRLLRKNGVKIPIIVVSASINKKLVVDLMDYNVTDFFVKPVVLDKLEEKIQNLTGFKEEPEQLKSTKRPLPRDPYSRSSLLIISENKNIINEPSILIPSEIIEKSGMRLIVKSSLHDAVNELKKKGSNIEVIFVDAANETYVAIMINLLKIVVSKIDIQVHFIATHFSQKFKDKLSEVGFTSFIPRGEYTQEHYVHVVDDALSSREHVSTKPTPSPRLSIIKKLSAIKTIPPMPDIFIKIENLAHDPKATAADYGTILEFDPGITARILRMSNSALYSFKRKIKTVKDAVSLMGTREILSLVRLACITGGLKSSPEVETMIREIWEHSACCSITAKILYKNTEICKQENLEDDLFIGGIIHDIGKIIIWDYFPETYMMFRLNPDVSPYPRPEEEERHLGTTHSEVGMELANHWKIPETFSEVIGYHHNPLQRQDSGLVLMIHIADYIARTIMFDDFNSPQNDIDKQVLEKIGYTTDQLKNLVEKLKPEIQHDTQILTKMIVT